MLILALDEILSDSEDLQVFAEASDSQSIPHWLAITSDRLLAVPMASASRFEMRSVTGHRLAEVTEVKPRRYIFRSRISFIDGDGKRMRYHMKGGATAGSLAEHLPSTPSPPA
jgi:hypothetical protein